jgi:hypothetical protein
VGPVDGGTTDPPDSACDLAGRAAKLSLSGTKHIAARRMSACSVRPIVPSAERG